MDCGPLRARWWIASFALLPKLADGGGDVLVSRKERDVLKDLGKQVAEIAALPVQQETISL